MSKNAISRIVELTPAPGAIKLIAEQAWIDYIVVNPINS